MSDSLKSVGKMPLVQEKLTMVEIIVRMVDETCFKRKVEMESRSHSLFGEA